MKSVSTLIFGLLYSVMGAACPNLIGKFDCEGQIINGAYKVKTIDVVESSFGPQFNVTVEWGKHSVVWRWSYPESGKSDSIDGAGNKMGTLAQESRCTDVSYHFGKFFDSCTPYMGSWSKVTVFGKKDNDLVFFHSTFAAGTAAVSAVLCTRIN